MFWLVEDDKQLELFKKFAKGEAFVEIIPNNHFEHPVNNGVCAVYIRPLNSNKGFILTNNHSETLNVGIDAIKCVLNALDKIYVRDKKEFLHYFVLQKLFDITLTSPTYIPDRTTSHQYFYYKYPNKEDVNRIVPIVKHYEYCENIFNDLKNRINEPINNFYNDKAAVVFNAVERSGLRIDRDRFKSYFYDERSEYVYTQYNFKTLTTRPANKFNGINYAALNKDNGCRTCFIPRNDKFVELDIGAYHPTLLGLLVGYDFGEEDIHKAFAKMYKVDYQKSKELTFKQLYGGVFEQFKDLEFFQRVQIYVDDLWQRFNKDGYIECPISKHLYKRDELDDMKPQKLLNYVLQNLETSMNVRILWDIFKSLKNRKTKLVLYTYDSFLFDFDESEVGLIEEIKQIIKNYKLQIKESYGSNYDFR